KLSKSLKSAGPFVEGLYFYSPNVGFYGTYDDMSADFDGSKEEWYTGALGTVGTEEEIYWTKPYVDESDGRNYITGSKVIMKNNQPVGVLAVDLNATRLSERMSSTTVGNTGAPFILREDGEVFFSLKEDEVGQNWSDQPIFQKATGEKGTLNGVREGQKVGISYKRMEDLGLLVYAAVENDEMASETRSFVTIGGSLLVASLLIAIVAALSIAGYL